MNTISELQDVTGLNISVNGNGNLIASEGEKDDNGNLRGSEEARSMFMHSIGDKKNTAFVSLSSKGKSYVGNSKREGEVGGNQIFLSREEISSFKRGAMGVDNRTMGYGIVFLHETLHSNVAEGGGQSDIGGWNHNQSVNRGSVVDRMNIVRRQMNAKGFNFGERSTYYMRSYIYQGQTVNTRENLIGFILHLCLMVCIWGLKYK